MASLAQLLANHRSILLVDAASARVQTGLLRAGAEPVWRSAEGEAGQLVFSGVEACLQQAGVGLEAVGAFVFCEGPGSMLGVRTVAMALRTWQTLGARPVYHYQSLAVVAHQLRRADSRRPFTVIADARRDTWHAVTVDSAGRVGPLRRVPSTELADGTEPLWQPTGFRAWASSPRPAAACGYDVAALVTGHADADLFTPTDTPDAFQHEAPEYKRWTAEVHSAANGRTAR